MNSNDTENEFLKAGESETISTHTCQSDQHRKEVDCDVSDTPGFVLESEKLTEELIRNALEPEKLRRIFTEFYNILSKSEKEHEAYRSEQLAKLQEAQSEREVFKEEVYKKLVEALERDLKCSICLEVFIEPIVLDNCGHTYCTHCIEEWKKNGIGNKCCPICGKSNLEQLTKNNGLDNFIKNVYANILSQEIRCRREQVIQNIVKEQERTAQEAAEVSEVQNSARVRNDILTASLLANFSFMDFQASNFLNLNSMRDIRTFGTLDNVNSISSSASAATVGTSAGGLSPIGRNIRMINDEEGPDDDESDQEVLLMSDMSDVFLSHDNLSSISSQVQIPEPSGTFSIPREDGAEQIPNSSENSFAARTVPVVHQPLRRSTRRSVLQRRPGNVELQRLNRRPRHVQRQRLQRRSVLEVTREQEANSDSLPSGNSMPTLTPVRNISHELEPAQFANESTLDLVLETTPNTTSQRGRRRPLNLNSVSSAVRRSRLGFFTPISSTDDSEEDVVQVRRHYHRRNSNGRIQMQISSDEETMEAD